MCFFGGGRESILARHTGDTTDKLGGRKGGGWRKKIKRNGTPPALPTRLKRTDLLPHETCSLFPCKMLSITSPLPFFPFPYSPSLFPSPVFAFRMDGRRKPNARRRKNTDALVHPLPLDLLLQCFSLQAPDCFSLTYQLRRLSSHGSHFPLREKKKKNKMYVIQLYSDILLIYFIPLEWRLGCPLPTGFMKTLSALRPAGLLSPCLSDGVVATSSSG